MDFVEVVRWTSECDITYHMTLISIDEAESGALTSQSDNGA
jgi:hypothetical protein